MVRETFLEMYFPVFFETREYNKLEKYEPIEIKEKRFSSIFLKIDGVKFAPEDFKDVTLRLVAIENLKESTFDATNLMIRTLSVTKQALGSTSASSKTENKVFDKTVWEYIQTVFHDFESYFRTVQLLERDFVFFLQNIFFRYITHELPTGIYEVSDVFDTKNNLVQFNVFIHITQ